MEIDNNNNIKSEDNLKDNYDENMKISKEEVKNDNLIFSPSEELTNKNSNINLNKEYQNEKNNLNQDNEIFKNDKNQIKSNKIDNFEEDSSNNKNSSNEENNKQSCSCNCFLICKCYNYGEVKHNTVEDIEILRSSFGFLKCDDTSITSILSQRNWTEKNLIIKKYSDKYNRSLEKDLKSHTRGNYKNAIIQILTEPSIYDTIQVRKSLKSNNLNNFNEIFITRNNQQKEIIKRIYLIKFESNLEHVIVGKYKGDMKELALAMINNSRDNDNSLDQFENTLSDRNSSTKVDMKLVEDDSNRLYQAGEGQKGTDIKPFIEIFTKRSFAHLSKLDSFYQNSNPKGHSLVKGIEYEFVRGKVKNTLLDILLYAKEPYKYWASCFNRALSGWGTKENDLTRLSITQHYQASYIKQAFLSSYNQSLILKISKKTSNKYKKLLLLLINV